MNARDVLEEAPGRPLIDDGTDIAGCMSREEPVVLPLDRAFAKAQPAATPHHI